MNEAEKQERREKKTDIDSVINVNEAGIDVPPLQRGLRERVWKLLHTLRGREPGSKQELAKDRTHSMALLIGGAVGAVLLFIAVFSTPTVPSVRESASHPSPNLGRPSTANQTPSTLRRSVTPLLNADVVSEDANSDQVSPADVQNTSRRASRDEIAGPSEPKADTLGFRGPNAQTRSIAAPGQHLQDMADALTAYRLNSSTEPRTNSYGVAGVATEGRIDATAGKSSIIFVRSSDPPQALAGTRQFVTTPVEQISLLPPGTRLLARLEAAATTAVKTPVVASVEYNYERDGMIVVPAGTKVLGDVQEASSQGYLSVRFHTIQMPDGREEKIDGIGVALDHRPLKGEVSGKNTGKKFLTGTLSGVGTVAAYVVGAGSTGLNKTVTGETMLRDRLAGNVALAGEQELMNAEYSQNISVTLPANTRFYVVLQKAALNTSNSAPSRIGGPASQSNGMPTMQELRELMDLRREINSLYLESNSTSSAGARP